MKKSRFTPPGGAEPKGARDVREAFEEALALPDPIAEFDRELAEATREYEGQPREVLLEIIVGGRAMLDDLKDRYERVKVEKARLETKLAKARVRSPSSSRKRSA